MAWDTGTITSATPWAALSQKVKDLISGGSGIANWAFVKNIPAGSGAGQSGSSSYSLDLFRCRGKTNLYSRVVQTNLCNQAITTDGTTFDFTTTSPSASVFTVVCVINTKASAADDPTSVAYTNGANNPTFTKIKSQAGGGSGEIKMTIWIGKNTTPAPTGTTCRATFGATQTGCMMIMDQFTGTDLTLGADGLDATGATKIGIATTGANGTTETIHQVTMGTYLGEKSVVVFYAAETASGGTYTNKTGWPANAADLSMSTPTAHARGEWKPMTNGVDLDQAPYLTLSSATSETSWCAVGFEFQRTTDATSITNANDAAKDWYFMIEIPAPDGATNSSMNCSEDYDGNELFRRLPYLITTVTPDSIDFSQNPTLAAYASVSNNNRASLLFTSLNTSGFTYYIKITPNFIIISARVGATEKTLGFGLLDSFVTNATEMPLMSLSSGNTVANTFTRLPGVSGSVSSGGNGSLYPWTQACAEGFTTNASNQQDLWASSKVHAARLFAAHTPGRVAGNSGANNWGYARGLWKQEILAVRSGGTVQLGDTMTIAGNTWTVIGTPAVYGSTGSTSCFLVTRAN
jgi:hypothetical protein